MTKIAWAPNWAIFDRNWALFCTKHLVTLLLSSSWSWLSLTKGAAVQFFSKRSGLGTNQLWGQNNHSRRLSKKKVNCNISELAYSTGPKLSFFNKGMSPNLIIPLSVTPSSTTDPSASCSSAPSSKIWSSGETPFPTTTTIDPRFLGS